MTDPTPDAEDRALVAQMRAGEEGAFAALFERYYERLRSFADSLVHSATEADEVVEDVFVRLWQGREQLEVRGSLRSYLYAATRNHALNRLRGDRVRRRWLAAATAEGRAPGMGAHPDQADAEARSRELAQAIDDAIAGLPNRCRQAFVMHRQHGLSHAEIAQVLEISPKTVENQIGRALRLLRDRLAPYLDP